MYYRIVVEQNRRKSCPPLLRLDFPLTCFLYEQKQWHENTPGHRPFACTALANNSLVLRIRVYIHRNTQEWHNCGENCKGQSCAKFATFLTQHVGVNTGWINHPATQPFCKESWFYSQENMYLASSHPPGRLPKDKSLKLLPLTTPNEFSVQLLTGFWLTCLRICPYVPQLDYKHPEDRKKCI